MSALQLAVQNSEVLRALAGSAADRPVSQLAREIGRDESNLRKTLAKLRETDLVEADTMALTAEASALMPRLDILEGRCGVPAGVVALRHDQILADPDNARKTFAAEDIDAMADSLRALGVQHPPRVRQLDDGRWQLSSGERRWRAWGLLVERGVWPADHLETCPVETQADARARAEASLVENEQRVDLNHMERGHAYERLATEFGRSNKEIAHTVGRTPEYVQQHRRLLRLSEADQVEVAEGRLPVHAALASLAARQAPEAELRDGIASHGATAVATPSPDLVEAPAVPKLSAKLALIMVELIHAAGTRPTQDVAVGPGWTEVAQLPVGDGASTLTERGWIAFRSLHGRTWASVTDSPAARAWIADFGLSSGAEAVAHFALMEARADVVGVNAAMRTEQGSFVTPWLNLPAERQSDLEDFTHEPAASPTSPPRDPAPEPERPSEEMIAAQQVVQTRRYLRRAVQVFAAMADGQIERGLMTGQPDVMAQRGAGELAHAALDALLDDQAPLAAVYLAVAVEQRQDGRDPHHDGMKAMLARVLPPIVTMDTPPAADAESALRLLTGAVRSLLAARDRRHIGTHGEIIATAPLADEAWRQLERALQVSAATLGEDAS